MKKVNKTTISLIAALVLSTFGYGCMDTGAKQDNPTLLLFLLGHRTTPDQPNQRKCLAAYSLANSCVGGTQFFNPGIGCVDANIKTEATYDALISCVNKAVNDPVQPCNLPQFKYALASQALAGAFASCNADFKFTPSGGTETTFALKDTLKY